MKKTETALVPFNILPQFELPQTAILDKASLESRDALIVKAKALKPITDAATLQAATDAGVEIHKAIKDAEAKFDELKKPLNRAKDLLGDLFKSYSDSLLAMKKNLGDQISRYKAEEQRKIDAEIERQRQETLRLEREATERQRKADEAALKVKGSKTLEKAVELQQQAAKANEAVLESLRTPVPILQKPAGASSRKVMRVEVSNIRLVYESNPLLCDIELKLAAVKSMFKPAEGATRDAPDKSVPGLLTWWEDNTSFRS